VTNSSLYFFQQTIFSQQRATQTVPALHFCKLAARKQKSKPADSASNNNFLLGQAHLQPSFIGRHFFMGCKSARPSFLFFASASADKKNKTTITADSFALTVAHYTRGQCHRKQKSTNRQQQVCAIAVYSIIVNFVFHIFVRYR